MSANSPAALSHTAWRRFATKDGGGNGSCFCCPLVLGRPHCSAGSERPAGVSQSLEPPQEGLSSKARCTAFLRTALPVAQTVVRG